MKATLGLTCIAVCVAAGCGGQSTSTSDHRPTQDSVAPAAPNSDLASQINELVVAANQAEADDRFADAIEIWRDARRRLAEQFGANHWQVANCDQAIAGAARLAEWTKLDRTAIDKLRAFEAQSLKQSQSGAVHAARDSILEAQRIAGEIFGTDGAIPLRLYILAGQLAQIQRDYIAAQRDFSNAFAMAVRLYPMAHPDVANILQYWGMAERQLGSFDKSIDLLRHSQSMTENLAGREETYATVTHELAVSLQRAGRLEEASREAAAAEQIRRTKLGERHPLLAESLVVQAVILMDQQQWDAAREKLVAAQQICGAVKTSIPLQQDIRLHLATVAVSERDFPEACRQLQAALEYAEQTTGRLSLDYAQVAYRLGMSSAFQANYEQAEPLFRHALRVQESMSAQDLAPARKTAQALSMLLDRTGRADEANRLRERFLYTATDAKPDTTQ